MRLKKTAATAGLGMVALLLTACGNGADPLAGGASASRSPAAGSGSLGSVVVGSTGTTESAILAEIYSQALSAHGIASSTKLVVGAREVYLEALQDGSISMIPEYTGDLLLSFDETASATTPQEIEAALPAVLPTDLKALKPAQAADQDVYVVTKEFAAGNGIASLADLSKVTAGLTLGGPPGLEAQAYGPPGLENIYGAKIKGLKPYRSPAVQTRDLLGGTIQLAAYSTTQSAITDHGLVRLQDPQAMILPQNVVPLVRSEVADNPAAVSTIEAVQSGLTTAGLSALNKRVDAERHEPQQVAAAYLKQQGLA